MWVYLNESPDATPEFLVYTDLDFNDQATPSLSNSVLVTNYGEIVQEEASPSILRFVDLSSRIDIRSFKGAFTSSLGGIENITFSLNVYESDSLDGPWLLSTTTSSLALGSLLLARNAKRYAKFEVVVDSELTDLSVLNFALLVEIAISEPNSPVLSRSAKNVLKKFPSWTKIYQDAEEQENENLYIPQSIGGKLVQSILNDNLDLLETQIDLHNVNRFIGSADINQVAWIYSSYDVPNNYNKILGDGIELTKISDLADFYEARQEDYVYYHNPLNRQIITLKKFSSLVANPVNGIPAALNQIPFLRFNWFDEFGARVGLNRLYMEDNVAFRYRILDVFKNRNDATTEGFKKTLRRELDLWRAFGATPNEATPDYYYDDNSLDHAATPEIMEIADIESSIEYFNLDGSPKDKFKNLVRYLNESYPSSWGYFRFNDSVWDTAGLDQEGIGRISSSYSDSLGEFDYYQPGVGDFSDGQILISNYDATPQHFETIIRASGKRKTGSVPYYSPIYVEYEYSGSYDQDVYFNESATVNLTLEARMLPYQNYTSNTDVYATFTRYVQNDYGPTSSASPEFQSIPIFDTEGYTSDYITFRRKSDNSQIVFSDETSSSYTKIPINKLSNVVLKNGIWNGSSYATPNSNNFNAFFSHRDESLISSKQLIGGSTPSFTQDLQIKIVSNIYNTEQVEYETEKSSQSIVINPYLENTKQNAELPLRTIESSIIYPQGATPKYINIYGKVPTDAINVPGYYDEETIDIYGGVSYYPEIDNNIFVPSSPNIIATSYDELAGTMGFIESLNGGATNNYYFGRLSYSLSSTPSSIVLSSSDGLIYPFDSISWEPFTLDASPSVSGIVDEKGIVNYSQQNQDMTPSLNSNVIFVENLNRESFGLSGEDKFDYFFETIKVVDPEDVNVSIWNDQTIVKPFLNRSFVLKDSISEAIDDETVSVLEVDYPSNSIIETYDEDNNTTTFSNITIRGKLYDYKLDAKINTGWIHSNQQEQYIYAKPVQDSFTGVLDKITLTNNPQQGAPVIIEITDEESTPLYSYREVAFPNSSTPGKMSFYNKEILKPKSNNSFYLGYENFYDLSIKDIYTGETIVENAASPTSIMHVDPEVKNLNVAREYEIFYKLSNSYYIDTELVDEQYVSSIYFDATPSATLNYLITYESSSYESSTPISVDFNPITSSISSSFVAYSDIEYDFDHIDVFISPSYIVNDGIDYVDISVFSFDANGNRKPYQYFDISSSQLDLSSSSITTDSEGYAHITATCSDGFSISSLTYDQIYFSGENSYEYTAEIEIVPANVQSPAQLISSASSRLIAADGFSNLYINGFVLNNNIPAENTIVYWRKARYIYDIFNDISFADNTDEPGQDSVSGYTITQSDGSFVIGPFISQENTNPGLWFVALETDLSSEFSESPANIAGDIVYWMEDFDPVNYVYGNTSGVQEIINYDSDKDLALYSTPTFVLSYYNGDNVDISPQSPLWTPPSWFSLSKYTQYQSGLWGSTPYYIEDYNSIRTDILRP